MNLNINLTKTKCIIFRKEGRVSKKDKLYLGQHLIENGKSYNYLGSLYLYQQKNSCVRHRIPDIKKQELPLTVCGLSSQGLNYNLCPLGHISSKL